MADDTATPLVLITGANSGLGFAVAQELASSGDCHVIVGARTQENADEAVTRMRADVEYPVSGRALSTVPLDLSDDASIASAASSVQVVSVRATS